MKLNKEDLKSFIFFTIIFVIFFQANILQQKIFFFRDISRYYYPTRFFVSESLTQGYFPFWNPFIYGGYPSFASLQQATFYPLSLLCFLFPFLNGFTWFFLMHFLLAGIGLFLLLRLMGLSSLSALVSAVVFTFSGYFVSTINLLTTLSAVTWIPWALIIFKKNMLPGRKIYIIVLAVIFSFQFMAGQPEIMYICALILLFYGLLYHWPSLKNLLAALFFAIFLASVQLFSFWEILQNSVRQTHMINHTVWSFHPVEMVNFLLPSFNSDLVGGSSKWFGQIWLRSGFLGIMVICLLIFGVGNKRRERNFFLLLIFAGLLLSFGKYVPFLSFVFNYVPGFNIIRYPVKYLVVFYFALAPLVGFGVEEIMSRQGLLRKYLFSLVILLIVCLTLLLGLTFKSAILTFLETNLGSLEKIIFHHRAPHLFKDLFSSAAVLAGFVVLLYLWLKQKISKMIFSLLFLILLTGHLFLGTYGTEPVIGKYFYNLTTHNAQFLKKDLNYDRIYLTPKTNHEAIKDIVIYPQVDWQEYFYKRQKALLPNLFVIHHLFSLDGYESIVLNSHERMRNLIASQSLENGQKYLDLLDVKYLLSFYPLQNKKFRQVRYDYLYLYQNLTPIRKLSFFTQAEFLNTKEDIELKLRQKKFNPLKEMFISGPMNPPDSSEIYQESLNASGKILNYTANKVEVEASSNRPSWLVLADTYYPGWKASINNQPAQIYQADGLLRALYLPEGDSRIILTFRPTWFWLSLLITLGSILIMITYSVHFLKKYSSLMCRKDQYGKN